LHCGGCGQGGGAARGGPTRATLCAPPTAGLALQEIGKSTKGLRPASSTLTAPAGGLIDLFSWSKKAKKKKKKEQQTERVEVVQAGRVLAQPLPRSPHGQDTARGRRAAALPFARVSTLQLRVTQTGYLYVNYNRYARRHRKVER
jgi:hypothetical protein